MSSEGVVGDSMTPSKRPQGKIAGRTLTEVYIRVSLQDVSRTEKIKEGCAPLTLVVVQNIGA